MRDQLPSPVSEGGRRSRAQEQESGRVEPGRSSGATSGPVGLPPRGGHGIAGIIALQRRVGNASVARWVGTEAMRPRIVQRLKVESGPPLAPGHYRYGSVIVGLAPGVIRQVLTEMAGRQGLPAERTWQQAFVSDMQSQSGSPQSYADPAGKQTIAVEPTLAQRAGEAQGRLEAQVLAVQNQFRQALLGSVRGLLDSSEQKLQAEGRRYGFPDQDSILRPAPTSAGAAALTPSMPGADPLRGVMAGARRLLTGKQKVAKARETIAKSGPVLGDALRPTVLEPALREYHELRRQVCGEYPILASVERNADRLAELSSGAQFAGTGATGPAAAVAMVKAKEEIRKELAEKLTNIGYVRSGMEEPEKVDRFWLDSALRANAKRALAIVPQTIQDVAVEEKVKTLQADAAFEARLKQAIGVALLVASFVPGAALAAGAVGGVIAAVDIAQAFQQYYWEEAAAGTAMEKAEAISQEDPSLFGLALSIAGGLLEGVAEAKALEGAIGVFKGVRAAYREARAAGVVAARAGGAAKAGAAAELVSATERLKTTADTASGKPGLGDRIAAGLPEDVKATAKSLDRSLKLIEDPGLRQLVLRGDKPVTRAGETLMDLAIEDPHGLRSDYAEWQRSRSGKPFEDWLRDIRQVPSHGILNDPAGVVEYGLNAAEARRSFDASVRLDPTREAGVWRDPATGEHVNVQGGPGFVEHDWMGHPDNRRNGRIPSWELLYHHHPSRAMAIDRLPSQGDFGQITRNQRTDGRPRPVTSVVVWTDAASGIRYETEFGFTPGTARPYWTRYRVNDGTTRIATFPEPPFGMGNNEYQGFLNSFTGRPGDPVPGGNLPPEVITEPPPSTKR